MFQRVEAIPLGIEHLAFSVGDVLGYRIAQVQIFRKLDFLIDAYSKQNFT